MVNMFKINNIYYSQYIIKYKYNNKLNCILKVLEKDIK